MTWDKRAEMLGPEEDPYDAEPPRDGLPAAREGRPSAAGPGDGRSLAAVALNDHIPRPQPVRP